MLECSAKEHFFRIGINAAMPHIYNDDCGTGGVQQHILQSRKRCKIDKHAPSIEAAAGCGQIADHPTPPLSAAVSTSLEQTCRILTGRSPFAGLKNKT